MYEYAQRGILHVGYDSPSKLNPSAAPCSCALADEKVEFIWGYPGGSVLYIYDELYKQDGIQHILVRHEQAAVHAADAYALYR